MRSLLDTVILVVDVSLSLLYVYSSISLWPAEFLLKDQLLSVWGFPCMLLVVFPLLLLIFFVFNLCYFSFSILGKFSAIISSKIFSYHFFFSSSSGIPIIQILVCLILSQRSLRLSSVLFTLFTFFCSSEVSPTILSSSSLICSSASEFLLLILSRVFLISVIVLSLHVYSLILLGLCLLILAFSPFCFQGF